MLSKFSTKTEGHTLKRGGWGEANRTHSHYFMNFNSTLFLDERVGLTVTNGGSLVAASLWIA